ncbi:hypothetical protein ATANTOWER_022287 [Ataeniobius toweri]|uniref:Uncharacterized protein n=1 Tax=Ataeniobius toweri TaxID=208326 RepID=A0ABU7B0S5_9TELE|nr:hypothetical protein [Ataeniobius toweri]
MFVNLKENRTEAIMFSPVGNSMTLCIDISTLAADEKNISTYFGIKLDQSGKRRGQILLFSVVIKPILSGQIISITLYLDYYKAIIFGSSQAAIACSQLMTSIKA